MRRLGASVALTLAALTQATPALAEPVVPQQGSSCGAELVGAATWPLEATAPLTCTPDGWQPVTTPYPSSTRWVSLGPPIKLHGAGLRNPVIASGPWTGIPLTPADRCRAEQLEVVPGVGTGSPQVSEGQPGQELSIVLVPLLFSVEFSGACLWEGAA